MALAATRRLAGALAVIALLAVGCGGGGIDSVADPNADPDVVLAAAAEAMGEIETVRFQLDHDGDPVHIDPADALEFEKAVGQFQAPRSAQAVLTVLVAGAIRTELGAIAINDDAWLQTALTGYGPLPPEYGIDPASLFDPKGGWRPLLAGLTDTGLVGVETRDGAENYHLSGRASAERIAAVTAAMVDDAVEFDVWIDAATSLVTRAEFTNDVASGTASWVIGLSEYGAEVTIKPPTTSG
jgi:hypothetical protein